MKREIKRLVKALVYENAAMILIDDAGCFAYDEKDAPLLDVYDIEEEFSRQINALVMRLENEARKLREQNA